MIGRYSVERKAGEKNEVKERSNKKVRVPVPSGFGKQETDRAHLSVDQCNFLSFAKVSSAFFFMVGSVALSRISVTYRMALPTFRISMPSFSILHSGILLTSFGDCAPVSNSQCVSVSINLKRIPLLYAWRGGARYRSFESILASSYTSIMTSAIAPFIVCSHTA